MNNFTVEELKERLARLDEVTLLELLNINSEELLEAFSDRIEGLYDKLLRALID